MRIDGKAAGFTAIELLVFIINCFLAGWFAILICRQFGSHIHGDGWLIVSFFLFFAVGFGLAGCFWYGLLRCLGFVQRRRRLRAQTHEGSDTKA